MRSPPVLSPGPERQLLPALLPGPERGHSRNHHEPRLFYSPGSAASVPAAGGAATSAIAGSMPSTRLLHTPDDNLARLMPRSIRGECALVLLARIRPRARRGRDA